MNIKEIIEAAKELKKSCKCPSCKEHYQEENISLIFSTDKEGVFELICKECKSQIIISTMKVKQERKHKGISKTEVSNMKSFLNTFDGNFSELFKDEL